MFKGEKYKSESDLVRRISILRLKNPLTTETFHLRYVSGVLTNPNLSLRNTLFFFHRKPRVSI